MSSFEIGAVVQFVSGGPRMTISSKTATAAKCVWFDNHNHVQTGAFALHLLVQPAAELLPSDSDIDAPSCPEIEFATSNGTAETHFAEVEAQLHQLLEKPEPIRGSQPIQADKSAADVPEELSVEDTPQAQDRDMILNKIAPLFEPRPPEQHGLPIAPTPKSYLDMIKRKFTPWS